MLFMIFFAFGIDEYVIDEHNHKFIKIRCSDPTKVVVGERNVADGEAKLLVSTKGHTVPLTLPDPTASGDSGDSINKIFYEENGAEQEHSTKKGDDVLEETIATDVPEIVVEKTKKKRKSKAVGDASGSTHPPKRLRDDFHAVTFDIGGIATLRGLILEEYSVSKLNLQARPLVARSSVTNVLVVTGIATTTIAADVSVVPPSPVRVVSGRSTSADRLAPPAFFSQLRAMDYDQLYAEFNVGAARQMCLGAEVRMRAEHTLEQKNSLGDKCSEQSAHILEKDTEIAHLRSLLSLKDSEAREAIRLREQVSALEAVDAVKGDERRGTLEIEVASLTAQFAQFTSDLSGSQFSCDKLNSKVVSLESERGGLVNQAIGCAINKGIQDGPKARVDHGKAGIDLSVIEAYDPPAESKYINVVNALVVHSRVQRVRGEIQEKRLSLLDVMVPLVEPLSSISLTVKASISVAPATADPITTLSMTFTSFGVVPPLSIPDYQVLDMEPHDGDPSSTA
nr:hypothetical protein [Tanacetum cinerariifolium]